MRCKRKEKKRAEGKKEEGEEKRVTVVSIVNDRQEALAHHHSRLDMMSSKSNRFIQQIRHRLSSLYKVDIDVYE